MSSLGRINIYLGLDNVQFHKGLSKFDYETEKFVKKFSVNLVNAK